MTISRAPRGIPTGGQFVASTHAEPTVSLGQPQSPRPHRSLREDELEDLQDAVDASREPAPRRSLGFNYGQIVDWRTKSAVDYDDLSDEEQAHIRSEARRLGMADPGRHRLIKSAERLRDDIEESVGDTVDALGGAAGHFMDVQRGDVSAPEVEGTFVGWNQMLPKFLRKRA